VALWGGRNKKGRSDFGPVDIAKGGSKAFSYFVSPGSLGSLMWREEHFPSRAVIIPSSGRLLN